MAGNAHTRVVIRALAADDFRGVLGDNHVAGIDPDGLVVVASIFATEFQPGQNVAGAVLDLNGRDFMVEGDR